MVIGLRIKAHRERLNYSQAHVAFLLDMNQSSYSRIESGAIDPRYSTLEAISRALNLKGVEDLICGSQATFSLTHNTNASGITVNQTVDYRDQYIETLKQQLDLLQRVIDIALKNKQSKNKKS